MGRRGRWRTWLLRGLHLGGNALAQAEGDGPADAHQMSRGLLQELFQREDAPPPRCTFPFLLPRDDVPPMLNREHTKKGMQAQEHFRYRRVSRSQRTVHGLSDPPHGEAAAHLGSVKDSEPVSARAAMMLLTRYRLLEVWEEIQGMVRCVACTPDHSLVCHWTTWCEIWVAAQQCRVTAWESVHQLRCLVEDHVVRVASATHLEDVDGSTSVEADAFQHSDDAARAAATSTFGGRRKHRHPKEEILPSLIPALLQRVLPTLNGVDDEHANTPRSPRWSLTHDVLQEAACARLRWVRRSAVVSVAILWLDEMLSRNKYLVWDEVIEVLSYEIMAYVKKEMQSDGVKMDPVACRAYRTIRAVLQSHLSRIPRDPRICNIYDIYVVLEAIPFPVEHWKTEKNGTPPCISSHLNRICRRVTRKLIYRAYS